jgi:hypothetical protein
MKKTITALLLAMSVSLVYAGGELKKVCHTDDKTHKEVCKTIKVHKKLEGHEIPEKGKK